MRSVRFRTLGCYPLTGAVGSEADVDPVIQEMLLTTVGTAGPGDRLRRIGVYGGKEAGGLLLMAAQTIQRQVNRLIAADIDAYLDVHERKDMLRFLTCGSVGDGKSTPDWQVAVRVTFGL
nr:hypothetical protein [Candidatus Microthrix sp.]